MKVSHALLLLVACVGWSALASAQLCETVFSEFPGSNFTTCANLPQSDATLSWSWGNVSRIFDATFVHKPEQRGGWIAWGINHNDSAQMAISSAIACYADAQTGVPIVKQYLLRNTEDSGVSLGGELNIVTNSCVIDTSTNPETIYLHFQLNLGRKPKIYQIYGGGPGVDTTTFTLKKHNPSTNFAGFIDVRNTTQILTVQSLHTDFKRTHGVLNAVGWGLLLPLGAMVARYLQPFADPFWFYLHGSCQVSGYILGSVGFWYGIKLRDWSSIDRNTHFTLGIIIYAIATLQIISVLGKPDKKAPIRFAWNVVHYTGGFSVIILAIVNNFIGFHILENYGSCRTAYIIVLAVLGGVAVILEVLTWIVWFNKKPAEEEEQFKVKASGIENGHGAE